jgi:hypothetical protein
MTEDAQQTAVGEEGIDFTTGQPVMEFSRAPRTETRTFPVIATYHLSEEGRKALLLSGGDGGAVQDIKVQVPTNRFHLVSVDSEGQPRLKLRPRYYLNANQEVARNDGPPIFDKVPTVEDLLKEAARNHQLERAYRAERAERQKQRKDAGFEAHQKLAEQFLADPSHRALEHPKPTPRKCYLVTRSGRDVLFDSKRDIGIARQVPPEAYRRFRQDYSQRREKNFEKRSHQLALHEERDRFVAEWVSRYGTPDHRERYAKGMLPLKELLDCVADAAFAAAKDKPLFVRDGGNQLQEYLRQFPQYGDVVVTKADLLIEGSNAETASESQWALVRGLRELLPDASVTLRVQRLSWKKDVHAPVLRTFLVLVTQQVGPFTVRREYLAPER